MAVAQWRFNYDAPGKDGCTARQHLERIWEQTGRKPALLEDEPPLHPAVEHIWSWFNRLSGTRGGGFGPAPITFQEIDAWARLTDSRPTPWEIEQLLRLDQIWLSETAKRIETKTAPKKTPKK